MSDLALAHNIPSIPNVQNNPSNSHQLFPLLADIPMHRMLQEYRYNQAMVQTLFERVVVLLEL